MTRLASWERRLEWPLTAVAVLFLTAYAVPILQPALPAGTRAVCAAVVWAAWAIVSFVRLAITEERWRLVHHFLTLLVLVRHGCRGWSRWSTSSPVRGAIAS
ncbi:hypothetical protein [Tenggerimyces flavus]|uniref:Uncharacterized protein n=1 Tax=Tenggerimyces flavus TaxID=1708749 RepID=A0ABV7YI35_9ACTN|nr:hypothetical protein [Tenggerimyces flavus]MBM7786816.1 hypothetical protein [Tenggerimyces flavus]